MAVPDGKPATDFSAMNREWVRGVASEAAGGGIPAPENPNDGDVLTYDSTTHEWKAAAPSRITVEALNATENTTYTAPEGKAYSPVTVNVPPPVSDFTTAAVTITNSGSDIAQVFLPFADDTETAEKAQGDFYLAVNQAQLFNVILYKGKALSSIPYSDTGCEYSAVTGSIELDLDGNAIITGNGTITITDI